MGTERVHFGAPAFDRLAAEMAAFLGWFNAPPDVDPLLKAAAQVVRKGHSRPAPERPSCSRASASWT